VRFLADILKGGEQEKEEDLFIFKDTIEECAVVCFTNGISSKSSSNKKSVVITSHCPERTVEYCRVVRYIVYLMY
jgi:hypothetical protein